MDKAPTSHGHNLPINFVHCHQVAQEILRALGPGLLRERARFDVLPVGQVSEVGSGILLDGLDPDVDESVKVALPTGESDCHGGW